MMDMWDDISIYLGNLLSHAWDGLVMAISTSYRLLDRLFESKPEIETPLAGIFICHFCQEEAPFLVNQYGRTTRQAVACDQCGKTNIITISGTPSRYTVESKLEQEPVKPQPEYEEMLPAPADWKPE